MKKMKLMMMMNIIILCFISLLQLTYSQQQFLKNKQLDCTSNTSSTLGYVCNGENLCSTYLTFRSDNPYNSPTLISYLLNSNATEVAQFNKVPDISPVPNNDIVVIPSTCGCTNGYYQHNASYTIKNTGETYLLIANDTYQGLTTCLALINANPYKATNLTKDQEIFVPLRCACPTKNQTASGIKYLLNYLITWGDTVEAIAERFDADYNSVLDANELDETSVIFPFNTLLVPIKSEPSPEIGLSLPPSPPPVANNPPADAGSTDTGGGSSKKWVFIGVGIGVGLLALVSVLLVWYFCNKRQNKLPVRTEKKILEDSYVASDISGRSPSTPFKSNEIRTYLDSLVMYKYAELETATARFAEDLRIRGSVYRATINGDDAAVKRLKGDVSNEIKILKQINHSNIVRLSGFCVHEGNTYLVYEFVERGSLSDWLHQDSGETMLSWKQRVRIAYDVADGLNYLHHYTNPPYIHKNVESSNILLDTEFRAKLANFGLAREIEEDIKLQLTQHVVGTQGYMAPEYLEHGLITPKLDVFAFGVVLLELISGKEATYPKEEEGKGDMHLSALVTKVLSGDDAKTKFKDFVDVTLQNDYPLDLAFSMAELAMCCVARDPASRPGMTEVLTAVSGIYNSSLDWDPSDVGGNTDSTVFGR